MIDAERVTRSIHRWLLSHLTALRAITRANTSTRADREQYRVIEILISNITFHSTANEHIKNFYDSTNYLNGLIGRIHDGTNLRIVVKFPVYINLEYLLFVLHIICHIVSL